MIYISISILAFVLVYGFVASRIGKHLLFYNSRGKSVTSGSLLRDLRFESVTFKSHDGLDLRGWYVYSASVESSKGCVVMLHGWHRDRRRIAEHVRMVAEQGFDVFAYDQRGHGESDTGMITFGPLEGKDLLVALDYCFERFNQVPQRTALVGFSLGTASIIYALGSTSEPPCSCVVLEGVSSTSLDSGRFLLERKYGRLVGNVVGYLIFTVGSALASQFRFRHSRSIDHVDGLKSIPKLLIRGRSDHMVPEESAMALIERAPPPKEVWINPGGGHTNNFESGRSEYTQRVISFIEENMASERSTL